MPGTREDESSPCRLDLEPQRDASTPAPTARGDYRARGSVPEVPQPHERSTQPMGNQDYRNARNATAHVDSWAGVSQMERERSGRRFAWVVTAQEPMTRNWHCLRV